MLFRGILSQSGRIKFKVKGQWTLFSIPPERIRRCIFGKNLVILAQIHYKLLHEQAKFPRILSQNGQNYEGQGQWPSFSIPPESIPWCMFGANLVIRAQICDDLSRDWSEFSRILSQNGQNDLEDQGQLSSIFSTSWEWCMLGANLVIPAQIWYKLSCRQSKDCVGVGVVGVVGWGWGGW